MHTYIIMVYKDWSYTMMNGNELVTYSAAATASCITLTTAQTSEKIQQYIVRVNPYVLLYCISLQLQLSNLNMSKMLFMYIIISVS